MSLFRKVIYESNCIGLVCWKWSKTCITQVAITCSRKRQHISFIRFCASKITKKIYDSYHIGHFRRMRRTSRAYISYRSLYRLILEITTTPVTSFIAERDLRLGLHTELFSGQRLVTERSRESHLLCITCISLVKETYISCCTSLFVWRVSRCICYESCSGKRTTSFEFFVWRDLWLVSQSSLCRRRPTSCT